ncbi:hypothetical protein [Actinomadura rubrisoli]|nr:hypothetical protein [Actinomadura rubrisoli]
MHLRRPETLPKGDARLLARLAAADMPTLRALMAQQDELARDRREGWR